MNSKWTQRKDAIVIIAEHSKCNAIGLDDRSTVRVAKL